MVDLWKRENNGLIRNILRQMKGSVINKTKLILKRNPKNFSAKETRAGIWYTNAICVDTYQLHKHKLEKKCETPQPSTDHQEIKIYYRNQFTNQYKQEEKQLKQIINSNVKPASKSNSVKLLVNYRSRKLSNLFIRNNPHKEPSPSYVVYRYTCEKEGCQPAQSYIGYTTSTLVERMRNHTQHGSILNHNNTIHNHKPTTQELVDNTKVIRKFATKQELLIAEALLIKEEAPLRSMLSARVKLAFSLFFYP